MEEITLTGGTILSSSSNPSSSVAIDAASQSSQQQDKKKTPLPVSTQLNALNQYHSAIKGGNHQAQMMMMMAAAQQQQQQQHGNGHSHGHLAHGQHSQGSCCHHHGPLPAPVIGLKMPPADYVRQQSQSDILGALTILTKMGRYSTLMDILEAWKEYQGATQVEEVLRRELIPPDAEGHTLLHWAAKRTEDLRFVQLWIRYIPADTRTTDNTGMSALHWACTEPNSFAIIQYILTYQPENDNNNNNNKKGGGDEDDDEKTLRQSNSQSSSSSSAARHNVTLLEMRDASGCTPLLLAAQHGHVETVAFLVHQFQARLDAVDDNGDSATHWAAYKGSAAVLGLLAYYEQDHDTTNGSSSNNGGPQQRVNMLTKPDAYGQTPLHLAALRGHSVACQYILKHICGPRNEHRRAALQLLSLPDKNGRTPYELAVHKKKMHTAVRLQQSERILQIMNGSSSSNHRSAAAATANGKLQQARIFFQTVVVDWLCSSHRWKSWLGIPTGLDDPMEVAPAFPNYYVVCHVILNIWFHYSVFVPIFNLGQGILWDCTTLHVMQFGLIVACVYTLYKCQTTNPGKLDDACPEIQYWRRLYGETLASYADPTHQSSSSSSLSSTHKWQLCHTCHIARPPRSKHDRNSGTCVLLFDHNCPFVGNTIGLYNYKWFYLFLLSMTWYFINHIVLLIKYVGRRHAAHTTTTSTTWSTPLWIWILGIYLPIHILMTGSLLIYHSQLSMLNLTTNEHVNLSRYDYLWTTTTTTSTGASSGTTATNFSKTNTDDKDDLDLEQGVAPSPQPPMLNRKYKNPWYKGVVGNLWDRFHPSHASYLLPEVSERLLSSSSSNSHPYTALYNNNKSNHNGSGIQMV
ncbi:hypothetical protein ACA910_004346 [Epithemia clementina (nom. ined.)]